MPPTPKPPPRPDCVPLSTVMPPRKPKGGKRKVKR
jgi:hypothetical protein